METYPGEGGEPREANVKTAEGTFNRPFQRLYPLEMSSTNEGVSVRARTVNPRLVEKKRDEVVKGER